MLQRILNKTDFHIGTSSHSPILKPFNFLTTWECRHPVRTQVSCGQVLSLPPFTIRQTLPAETHPVPHCVSPERGRKLPKQVICLISPVGWVHLFALSAGLHGARRMVIVLPRRGPTGWGEGGSTCMSTLESLENTFGSGRAGRGRIVGTPFAPDRQIGGFVPHGGSIMQRHSQHGLMLVIMLPV